MRCIFSVFVFIVLAAGFPISAKAEVQIHGAGATFPEPLYKLWIAEFAKVAPNLAIDYQGIGSGGGIKGIINQAVDFVGSDVPMSKKELEAAGGQDNIVEIPSCAGAVVPAYNLPGINAEVNFTGAILAEIYLGKISNWNDPKLQAINPKVKLPNLLITPTYRTDGSGTNFIFTNYLSSRSEDFRRTIGTGKAVKWPVGQGGKGGAGMAVPIIQNPGSIGYLEWIDADRNKISYGTVQNAAGKFVKATPQTVSAAGTSAAAKMKGHILTPDIWNQKGDNVYPIASFTYLIVYKDLKNLKNKEQAQALLRFLNWAIRDGQKFAVDHGYAPLAAPVQAKVDKAISEITFKGLAPVTSY